MERADAELVTSERLVLEPVSIEHAAEMVDVLADPALYEYMGGKAPSLERLQARYAAQSVGRSGDGSQWWLNWIVKLKNGDVPVGFVQATVESDGQERVANIGWVISPCRQGQGIATEATQAMVSWLQSQGVNAFVAYIHPGHRASMGVARRQGMGPTTVIKDGEIRWESQAGDS